MESLSLSKLNLYLKRVITLNFQEPIWVSAELLSLKEKSGHLYLELTEKDAQNNITAQNTAIIWKTSHVTIKNSTNFDLNLILKEGNEIRILVVVDYNVRYGLKLIVQNIDPEYTFGKIAQARMIAIERLQQEKIWQMNKSTAMPIAIQNIAIIASKGSAGFKDFENHIIDNAFGYTFNMTLANVSVQGINSIPEICKAFNTLNKKDSKYDIIVLIRGGGSRHDLLEFDSYEIAKEISLTRIPVLTGIGHFIDESIADLSAYKSLKTPTAVADFILSQNREYELHNFNLLDSIINDSKHMISNASYDLSAINSEVYRVANSIAFDRYKILSEMSYNLNSLVYSRNHEAYKKIVEFNLVIESNDPELILQKGYSLTYKENCLISKCNSMEVGDELKTIFKNGIITSNVNKSWESKK